MPKVMAKRSQAQTGTQHVPSGCRRERKPAETTIKRHPRKVHRPKRVDIASVGRPRERQVGEAQLANSPQSLHHGMIDDCKLTRRDDDRTMNRIADFKTGRNMNRHADN